MRTKNIDIESLVRRELDSFELPYDAAEWLGTAKRLNKNLFKKSLVKSLIITTLASVIFLSYYLISQSASNNENNNKPVAAENNEVKNQKDYQKNELSSNTDLRPIIVENSKTENPVQVQNQLKDEEKSEINKEEKSTNTIIINPVAEESPSVPTLSKNPIPYFTISQKKGCAPLEVTFYPYENSDSMVYYWEFGDGKFSNEKFPTHEYISEGKYQIRLSIKPYKNDKVISWTTDEPVEVLEQPVVDFELVSSKNPYEFRVLTNPTLSYSWDFGDSGKASGNLVKHSYYKEKNYSVRLLGSDENGCVGEIVHSIEVENLISVVFPDAFRPDGDGFNDFYGPVFSPEEEITDYSMQIFNEYGQLVFSSNKPEILWDGKIQHTNKECEMGIYHAVFKIRNKLNIYKEYKSKITLLK